MKTKPQMNIKHSSHPMVAAWSESNAPLTNCAATLDLPTPVSPSKTSFTSAASISADAMTAGGDRFDVVCRTEADSRDQLDLAFVGGQAC